LLSLFVGIVLSVFFVFNVFASISSVAVNFINPGPLNAVLTNYFSFSQIAHLGVNMNTVYILVLSPFFMTGWFTYGLSVIQDKTFFVLMAVIVVVSQFVRVHSWKHLMKNYVSANL
jgi:hypothetical protein